MKNSRSWPILPWWTAAPLAALTVVIGVAQGDAVECGAADGDAVHKARLAIERRCGCESAHRDVFLACAGTLIDRRIASDRLPRACRPNVMSALRRSTCGRADAVVCCRTLADGRLSARVARTEEACRASAGGSACVSSARSVVDGCFGGTCERCGNGVIESSEECDGESFCSSACTIFVRWCCAARNLSLCRGGRYSPPETERFPQDCPGQAAGLGAMCLETGECVPDPSSGDLSAAEICCDTPAGCSEGIGVDGLCVADFMTTTVLRRVVGTCGENGRCQARLPLTIP